MNRAIRLGLIGASSDWSHQFGPALARLNGRVRIAAVHDIVASRGAMFASEVGARTIASIRDLAEHPTLRAAIVADTEWQGSWPIEALVESGKDVLFLTSVAVNGENLDRLHDAVADRGVTCVPAATWRYEPSMLRIRELIATRLGPVKRIELRMPGPVTLADPRLLPLFDWVCWLSPHRPRTVEAQPAEVSGEVRLGRATIQFISARENQPAVVGELLFDSDEGSGESGEPSLTLHCQAGTATSYGPNRLSWQNGREGKDENLRSERSAAEVLLDHFTRRLVGGLVPLPGLDDWRRAQRLLLAAEESLRSGEAVDVVE